MFFSVNEERSDFKKRLHIFEYIFNLCFIPISVYDFAGVDFKSSPLSFYVVGNKNTDTVKQLVRNNDISFFRYLDFKAVNGLYHAIFQPFLNDNRM